MSQRRRSGRSQRKRTAEPFLEKGLQLLAVAGTLWLGSLFMSDSPVLAGAAGGLRSVLWLPMTIGFGLLAVHLLLKRFAGKRPNPEAFEAVAPRKDAQTARPLDIETASASTAAVPSSQTQTVPSEVHPPRQSHWSSEVFSAIEWRRFEAVVEALFAQAGFETRSQSHGADGGVDIWLYSRNADGPVSVVQCKHWQGKPVTVKEMREFLGVMVSKGVKRGTYATTSRYTADALEFAKAHGINAQDGTGLLRLIAQRTPEQQAQLLAVAYEGEYWKPTCASCGVKMTERTSGKDGNRFWGCVNYPRCKRTLPMRTA